MVKVQKKKAKIVRKTKTAYGIKEIIDEISKQEEAEGITKADIKRVISSLLEVIDETLIKGGKIEFTGHFSIYTTKQEERRMTLQFGKKKGQVTKVAARLVPRVKFSSTFKKEMIEE